MIYLSSRSPNYNEIDKIVSWLNDKDLMKYSEQRYKNHTRETQDSYLMSPDRYRLIYDTPFTLVGTITAILDNQNMVADIGILIGSEHKGCGYGAEAWRKFSQELATDGIRKIEAGCMAKNKAMIRVFEKNGMILEGTRRYHFQTGKDQYDDMVLYGMLT